MRSYFCFGFCGFCGWLAFCLLPEHIHYAGLRHAFYFFLGLSKREVVGCYSVDVALLGGIFLLALIFALKAALLSFGQDAGVFCPAFAFPYLLFGVALENFLSS